MTITLNGKLYNPTQHTFKGKSVDVYTIDGRLYIPLEHVGQCLGMKNPKKDMNRLYNKRRDELKGFVKDAEQ